MRIKFATIATLLVAVQVQAAGVDVEFSGTVQRDGMRVTSFDVSVPAGETSKLVLGDGTALEFSAAASHGSPAQSVVRLVDAGGKQLHSETTPGNAPMQKSLRYTICGSRVIFQSPSTLPETSCGSI